MLHFTDHAKDRMKERRISKQEVQYCLENYEASYPNDDEDNGKMNYVCTTPTGRRIRVVIDEKRPTHRIVISVMD